MIQSIMHSIQSIGFMIAFRESALVYPVILSTHLAMIALFGGLILMTDLRLMGLALKSYTITEVITSLRPWKHVGLTIMLFFCAAGFIAYRWLITTEPSALLIVETPNLLSGAKIFVQSVEDSTSQTAIVGDRNYFTIPFHLDPGSYTIQITLGDKDVYKADFSLRHNEMGRIDLSRWEPPPATSPATQPSS